MYMSDAQAAGKACVTCRKLGTADDGEIVGHIDDIPVWACLGGCTFMFRLFHNAERT